MLFPIKKYDYNKCRFSSLFGMRNGVKHRGIDIAMPEGTEIIAPLDGKVLYCRVNSGGVKKGYGYYLVLYHYKEGKYTLYGHLKELPNFKVGDYIKAGDIIAYSGNTGESTGSHLHFEIHVGAFLFSSQVKDKDSAVDPTYFYPNLIDFYGKFLTGFDTELKKGENMKVEFKDFWQEPLLKETIQSLGEKGLLDAEFWLKKINTDTMTVSDLGLLALVLHDRKE